MSRKGNTNVITGSQNIADANVTGSLVYLNNGAVKLQSGLGKLATEREIKSSVNFRNVFKSGNVATALNSFFSNVEGQYKSFSFANDSILYWVVKKKYSYREIVRYSSTNSLFTQGFLSKIVPQGLTRFANEAATSLQNFANNPLIQAGSSLIGVTPTDLGTADLSNFNDVTSDSIGVMANTKYMQLDSTLPLIDITQERYGVPIPFSASSENKISPTTRNIMYNLSKFNTALMRRNLIPVAYGNTTVVANLAVDATLAHGVNLVNDLPTFVKLNSGIGTLFSALIGIISNPRVFQYIGYLSNIGNKSGFNYRDNRPAMASDKDFVLLKGEEQAAGIVSEINEMASMAQAQAAIQKIAQSDVIEKYFSGRSSVVLPRGTISESGQTGVYAAATGNISTTATAQNAGQITSFSFNNDGNRTQDTTLSNTYLGKTASGIPNDSEILGYTIPLDSSLSKVQLDANGNPVARLRQPAIVTFTDANGKSYKVLAVGNDTGGKWVGNNSSQRTWGEFGSNTYRALQSQGLGVDIGRNAKGTPFLNMPKGTTASFEFLEGNITNVQQYRDLQSQLTSQGRIGTSYQANSNTGANISAVTQAATQAATINQNERIVEVDLPAWESGATNIPSETPLSSPGAVPTTAANDYITLPGEVGTPNQLASSSGASDAFAPTSLTAQLPATGTPSSTDALAPTSLTLNPPGVIAAPGFSGTQTQQAATGTSLLQDVVSLMSGIGAGKFSNRQSADIFTFFINVEGVYQKVDYLLKSVRTGFNPSKAIQQRLSTTATTAASNNLDTSSPATAAAQLSLLGVPPGLADTTSALLGGMFDNDNSNDVVTGLISDKYNDYIDGAMENPMAQTITSYYDGGAGAINQLGGLLGADPTLGPLLPSSSELIDVLDPGTFFEGLEIPSILPSVDLGSIKDLLSLAASVATSGPPTSLTGFIKMQEQLYSIICNFELPIIDFPAIEALLKTDFKDLDDKIKTMVERFVNRIIDRFNIVKLLKNINKTFKETLDALKKQFIKQFLSCEKYKKADKSGKPSVGG
jgi:hypothetical protein